MRIFLLCLSVLVYVFAFDLKSLFTYTFDANVKYDMNKAKQLYFKNKCNTCHGDDASKKAFNFKALNQMSAPDLKAALISYKLESQSISASQMALYAKNLSDEDINYLIAYILGEDFASKEKDNNGIFLK